MLARIVDSILSMIVDDEAPLFRKNCVAQVRSEIQPKKGYPTRGATIDWSQDYQPNDS